MKKYNFIIVGCGKIASRHAELINKYGNLVAVCDIVPERARILANKYNCKYYTNLDDLLFNEKDIDVASICSPNYLHKEQTIKCFQSGINALCEKPMALNVSDAEQMIYEAEKRNKKLFIVKQNRFNPPIEKLKQIIENDLLGRVFSVNVNCFWNRNSKYYSESDWKGIKEKDGGILFTQFSHFIDILHWIFGDVKKMFGITKNQNHRDIIEFEDCGVVVFEFMSGAIGSLNFTVNSYSKNMEGSITVFAEKGTVKIGGQYMNVLEYQDMDSFTIEDLPEPEPANDYGHYKGSMSNHHKVYENVIDVLDNDASIATNAMEGLKTIQIIDRIYKNSNLKQVIVYE